LKHYVSNETEFWLQNFLFITLADDVCIRDWHHVHVKAVRTSINLGCGSGLCWSSSLLLPHPRNHCATHKCLPFSPASPTTFFTCPRRGITGVAVLRVQAGFHYYTFQKHLVISLHFLRNDSAGISLLLFIPKNIIKWSFRVYRVSGPRILNDWRGKATLWGTMHLIQLYIVYMAVVPGLEKMNDTCGKTMHMGMMDKRFHCD
jgi:hypothetical protein